MSGTDNLGDLLRRYHNVGDESAIDELVRRTRPRLLRVARRIGSPQDAEDTVQSAYLALARKRGEPFDAPVLGWLITAVVRIAYRRKALEARQHDLSLRLSTEREAPSAATDASEAEVRARIRRDVDRLPAKYRDAIVLHHLEGLTMAQIGGLQDVPEATVRTRVRRGRELLRGRLHIVWHGMLAPLWLFQDALRPIAGGYAVKKKTLAVVALLLLVLGIGTVALKTIDGAPDRQARTRSRPSARGAPAVAADALKQDNESPVAPTARVTGVVLDFEGRPVRGATIRTMTDQGRAQAHSTRTDAGGRFTVILESEAPHHRIWATADGFSPSLVEPVSDGDDVSITLDPMSTLSGVVFDPDGKSVAGARVTWFVPGTRFRLKRTATSDAHGAFKIAGLPAPWTSAAHELARYVASLTVVAEGFAMLVTLAPVPSPRTGSELHMDLHLGRGATVKGKVLDGSTGRPLPNAHVVLGSMPGAPLEYRYGEEQTGADGRFEMNDVPGDGFHWILGYGGGSDRKLAVLRAQKEGYATATADVSVVRETKTVEVEVRCWRTGLVRGRVIHADGKPVAGLGVTATSMVQLDRSLWDPGGTRAKASTDKRGRYEFEMPGPGLVKIGTHAKDRSARIIDVDVAPGSTTNARDIVLGEPHASAIVEVVDEAGHPIWGANVWLRPQSGFFRTGRDGRVRVFCKDGGEVRAVASSFDSGERQSEPFVPGTKDVLVRIKLDATKTIHGHVLSADGSPAAGARVDAVGQSGGSIATADRTGAFELRRLVAGSYRISASHWDLAGQHATNSANDIRTGSREVVLKLPPFPAPGTLILEGRVLDQRTNEPVVMFTAYLGNKKRGLTVERLPGGRFRVRGVSPGHWRLTVMAAGYTTHSRGGIEVREGTRVEALEVRLREGIRIRGKLTAPDGIDVTGVAFMLVRADGFQMGYQQLPTHGRYKIDAVPPGRYRPRVLSPIGLAAATDAVVDVRPGAREVKFDFRVAKGGWLAVTLAPGAHEIRYLDASERVIWTATKVGAVKLPVGSYTVQLLREKGKPIERTCNVAEGGTTRLAFDDGG